MKHALEEWMEDAKCRDDIASGAMTISEADLLFFPSNSNQQGTARRYCDGKGDRRPCPVRAECLSYALRTDSPHGVWGARSTGQRAALKRQAAAGG